MTCRLLRASQIVQKMILRDVDGPVAFSLGRPPLMVASLVCSISVVSLPISRCDQSAVWRAMTLPSAKTNFQLTRALACRAGSLPACVGHTFLCRWLRASQIVRNSLLRDVAGPVAFSLGHPPITLRAWRVPFFVFLFLCLQCDQPSVLRGGVDERSSVKFSEVQ